MMGEIDAEAEEERRTGKAVKRDWEWRWSDGGERSPGSSAG